MNSLPQSLPPSRTRARSVRRSLCRSAALGGLLLASGCGSLLPKATPNPSLYALDSAPAPSANTASAARPSGTAPTLVVNPTRAAPGFDSQHIVYVRLAHQREHFAHSDWVDTPARMLAPLIAAAVEHTSTFSAVGPLASGLHANLRLDTEVLRLQHEFGGGPSRVRFTLRATVLDGSTRRVLAWREIDETVASASEDPYGGVVAANRAVQLVMAQLAAFCAEAARSWVPPG
ncbi:MAG: membrane integrity-associated transporter subunit PqiC [Rhizobacter sp.]|nr:membrane integrity-associated transporter subunit PqiC [Rhizobacter sp.]